VAANHSLARTAQPDDEGLSAGSARVPTLRLLFGKSRGIVASSPGMGGLGLLGALPIRWQLDRPHALQIGRGAPSDEVCLADDSQASRLHASLLVVPGQPPLLRDLGSSNGTFVNGARIQQASLCDGDVVRVGSTLFLLREEPQPCPDAQVPSLIGQSPAICHLRHEVALWAPSLCTVLLLGDSGTGKEVTAQALHALSGQKGPLVAVNCAAIPETLAESQLFGHVSGAFTGAKAHPGYFRAAHFGTLFLDEVGELPASLQPKLLRALEEGVITPVGSVEPQPCKVRVIAATNRNLPSEVERGTLRGDLFARLSEIVLRLPPVRERREDILPLLGHFLGHSPPLAPALAEALLLHRWPWNVRELSKVATELRVRGAKLPQLTLDLIKDRLVPAPEPPPPPSHPAKALPEPPSASLPSEPPPIRKDELVEALSTHGGRIAVVARALGRSRQQIYRLLELHGLSLSDFRDGSQDPE
jgi:DNA-binding NtrC family response regulator